MMLIERVTSRAIKEASAGQGSQGSWGDVFKLRKQLIIAASIVCIQQLSGINAVCALSIRNLLYNI